MLKLHPQEQIWLTDYCRALQQKYAGAVLRVLVYGSKARGDAHGDSDVDVLVFMRERDFHLQKSVREIGYSHDLVAHGYVAPSILAYTQTTWQARKKRGYPFQRAVERDAVVVYEGGGVYEH